MNTRKTKVKRVKKVKTYKCKKCRKAFFSRGNRLHHYASTRCGH